VGENANIDVTTGVGNTAIGNEAVANNRTGNYNTAVGLNALVGPPFGPSSGDENTAIGDLALGNNSGNDNTATGNETLLNNTTGSDNTGDGNSALHANVTGAFNTATGENALFKSTSGSFNTATGSAALYNQSTGNSNTGDGIGALFSNSTGSNNIALGSLAGLLLTTGDNNIDIANYGVGGESNTIRVGTQGTQMATYIAGITNVTLPNGVGVVVDSSTGQLGVTSSSRRFKAGIKPMNQVSEAILALKPVTFHYKSDAKNTQCFGLIAEEVAAVNSNLVVRDKEGKPYSVRYDQVNAMLLNEFLKEHKKVEEQGAMIVRQQKQIEALTAGLQKVSAQLEVSQTAPQTVLNNR
jgi:hypothetical protein